MSQTKRIPASVATCRWGGFDASFAPVASIASGETIILECVSGGPEVMPGPEKGLPLHHAISEIHAKLPRLGAHIITGPVEVRGAEPGDALRVDIEKIELGADWGFCGFRPLFGTLPEDFPYRRTLHIPVNKQAMTCRLPFGPQDGGLDLPLAPFFGVMGVAPPPEWGMVNTKEPRAIGGNLDNKELTEGTTLFLPIFNKGALFSAGDGHGVQGDGEVCINALEICLTGHFKLSVVKGGGAKDPVLKFPRAETKTHFITMGMNEDLDLAMKQALREMIAFICSRTNLSDADAYQFCSLAVDFRVTQTVNGEKGVHGMLKKGLLF